MSNTIKQPNIKLIPSDPTTNTILILYCVASNGVSVPYKSTWRKIHQKLKTIQEIKNQNGGSYRCSPLDLDYVIEASVFIQQQNLHYTKVVQSNIVKMSRDLKDKRVMKSKWFPVRLNVQESAIQGKIVVQDDTIKIKIDDKNKSVELKIQISSISIQVGSNQLVFKIIFKNKNLDQWRELLGPKQKYNHNFVIVSFQFDIQRDLVLLAITESLKKNKQSFISHKNTSIKKIICELNTVKKNQQQLIQNKNKSQFFLSPPSALKQKLRKMTSVMPSFENQNLNSHLSIKQNKTVTTIASPSAKKQNIIQKSFSNSITLKQRDCLNVFQEENAKDQILPGPLQSQSQSKSNNLNLNDQPSINLRGSFEQLQKSFNCQNQKSFNSHNQKSFNSYNLSEQKFDRIVTKLDYKSIESELNSLKIQNQKLKKQAQLVNSLISENIKLKKQQTKMKEQISRLEIEKKAILTDKLRCQVNLNKEKQQKETLKNELYTFKQKIRQNTSLELPNPMLQKSTKTTVQRSTKTSAPINHYKFSFNRSPNSSFNY